VRIILKIDTCIIFKCVLKNNVSKNFTRLQNNVAINLNKNLMILYVTYHVTAIFYISEEFGDGMKSILAEWSLRTSKL